MSELIKDGSFEIEKTKNYNLSIQVCLDGFSFLIVDPVEKKVLAIKNSALKISNVNLLARHLKEWLESEVLLKNTFKKVRLFFYSENFTLIPEEYFGRERQKNLTSVLFDKKAGGNFFENSLENIGVSLFFPVSQDVINVSAQFFKNIEIFHPIANAVQACIGRNMRNVAFILSTRNYFYLVVFGNGDLLLASSYPNLHPNDLVYNVINAFQQLGIARVETELLINVAIDQKTEIDTLLSPYFAKIKFLKIEELFAKPDITHPWI